MSIPDRFKEVTFEVRPYASEYNVATKREDLDRSYSLLGRAVGTYGLTRLEAAFICDAINFYKNVCMLDGTR